MKRFLLPILSILSVAPTHAQDVSGLLDYRGHFFVCDAGTFKELEPLAPRGYTSGGGLLSYAATNSAPKVYRNDRHHTAYQTGHTRVHHA